MRATPRYTQQAPARRYSIEEICAMVDNGTIMAKPMNDRIRIKKILKANAEAQHAFGLSAPQVRQKQVHFAAEENLLKYYRKIELKTNK